MNNTYSNTGYLDHTHPLFITSKLLKLTDIDNFQIIQIMYKAFNYSLPLNIQNLFKSQDVKVQLRSLNNFKIIKI